MLFVMAILAKIFQVVQVKGHAWVMDVSRRDIILVMNDHTRPIKSGGSAPLARLMTVCLAFFQAVDL